ncbi:tetratricopeptide repeat protein [Myxococcus sp. K15C18031901]|uniref:tetratricopeptide repeat protein n=1 Tax=Myxococcus dinghuensis TaxID=2906761 RepID=UPI0020A6FFCB|nr:tetratricopeptide repeat protein [Myxococcus dinghuensis]MCP3101312.1 tetratricopeptide repeat protein [Myxococcus dinghuensis]
MTALSVISGLAWAGPKLSGSYAMDAYGQVEFRMDGERLVGTSSGSGGECKFAPGTEVITGEFQGNVLVGKVRLCLEGGAECAGTQDVPVMAFYNPQSTTLSALFRLGAGCRSKALIRPEQGNTQQNGTQLVLRRTGGPVESEEEPPSPKGGSGSGGQSASEAAAVPSATGALQVAAARPRAQDGRSPVDEGQHLLANNKHQLAKTQFEAALRQDPRNVDALLGLVACELNQGNASKAEEHLERLKGVTARPDVFLWQARTQAQLGNSQRSVELVRKALALGWNPSAPPRPWEQQMVKELSGEIELARSAKGRKRPPQGSGSTSP